LSRSAATICSIDSCRLVFAMHIETEAKFELATEQLEAVRLRLAEMKASRLSGPAMEENVLYDFPDHRLRKSGSALRLRSYADTVLLTFKGPVKRDSTLKEREEIETELQDASALRQILDRLGLEPCFSYSKTREIYQVESSGSRLQVCLDQTPVGCFVEIEGDAEGIRRLAALFGWSDFIKKSYIEIYQERGR
jgi:adenylate cyclase, class 2